MFPLGNAARATRWVSLGIGAISCGWSDIAILLGSKDGDQTPSLQTLLASGLCEITLRCLMMPHEIGIGPRLMSCKSEFASSISSGHLLAQERQGGRFEVGECCTTSIVRNTLVHQAPKPLDWIEMRAIGGDEVQ